VGGVLILLVVAQAVALLLLLVRLLPGRRRLPPVAPRPDGIADTTVTVLLPCYNEARRIGRCLDGLTRQGPPLQQVVVVDSRSTDGTGALVQEAARRDPRIQLVTDPPVPSGWVGKVWALQHGLGHATGEWVLGVDADTEPQAGMVAGAVAEARAQAWDAVSFSPSFAGMSVAEQWLQPSMLLTIVYRVGAAGSRDPAPDRVMANGQCFLARRAVLLEHGGYEPARASWADDVTLARHLARRGARVAFMDGSRLYDVRAYEGARQMWREWGRSFDLTDATTRATQWFDVAFIALVQGVPLVILLALAFGAWGGGGAWSRALLWLNAALVGIRCLMLGALAGSYRERSVGFWLSPLSDPAAALRLLLSTLRRPRDWRGRAFTTGDDGA
jgi:dolichol-phosphate mannosyltransferase